MPGSRRCWLTGGPAASASAAASAASTKAEEKGGGPKEQQDEEQQQPQQQQQQGEQERVEEAVSDPYVPPAQQQQQQQQQQPERVEEEVYDPSVGPPEEPGAGACCGSDCRDCVYIEYWCVPINHLHVRGTLTQSHETQSACPSIIYAVGLSIPTSQLPCIRLRVRDLTTVETLGRGGGVSPRSPFPLLLGRFFGGVVDDHPFCSIHLRHLSFRWVGFFSGC